MPTTKPATACCCKATRLRAEALMKLAREDAKNRWQLYQNMAAMKYGTNGGDEKKN